MKFKVTWPFFEWTRVQRPEFIWKSKLTVVTAPLNLTVRNMLVSCNLKKPQSTSWNRINYCYMLYNRSPTDLVLLKGNLFKDVSEAKWRFYRLIRWLCGTIKIWRSWNTSVNHVKKPFISVSVQQYELDVCIYLIIKPRKGKIKTRPVKAFQVS